jgi:hypothetical protein
MRIARAVGPGLVPALLVAAVAAGCGGHQASGQVVPDNRGRRVAVVSGEEVLPGNRRAPDGASALTTTTTQPPIARTSSPVPSPVPATRPPLMLGVVATPRTSPAPIPTTTATTAPTGARQSAGSGGGASRTEEDAPTTTTTVGILGRGPGT